MLPLVWKIEALLDFYESGKVPNESRHPITQLSFPIQVDKLLRQCSYCTYLGRARPQLWAYVEFSKGLYTRWVQKTPPNPTQQNPTGCNKQMQNQLFCPRQENHSNQKISSTSLVPLLCQRRDDGRLSNAGARVLYKAPLSRFFSAHSSSSSSSLVFSRAPHSPPPSSLHSTFSFFFPGFL